MLALNGTGGMKWETMELQIELKENKGSARESDELKNL